MLLNQSKQQTRSRRSQRRLRHVHWLCYLQCCVVGLGIKSLIIQRFLSNGSDTCDRRCDLACPLLSLSEPSRRRHCHDERICRFPRRYSIRFFICKECANQESTGEMSPAFRLSTASRVRAFDSSNCYNTKYRRCELSYYSYKIDNSYS